MKFLITFIALFAAASSSSVQAKEKVGGPCAYEKFEGVCKIEKGGGEYFVFEGMVNERKVILRKNKLGFGAKLEDNAPCSLQFIKTGTCTPCVFSIGECGREAWKLFRKP